MSGPDWDIYFFHYSPDISVFKGPDNNFDLPRDWIQMFSEQSYLNNSDYDNEESF